MSSSLRLDWCSFEAAKYACEHWHYSGQMPNGKAVKLGVWEAGRFIGAVVFGDGANGSAFEPYGISRLEGAELVRVALRAHETPVSRIVAVGLRLLRRRCPGIRVVVSYADPEQGHIGAIYQIGGWIYAGRTAVADEYVVRGVRMHGKALRQTRSTHPRGGTAAANVEEWARKVLDPGIRKVRGSSKYRYLYPMDREMRARLAPLAQPWPRRRSIESDALGSQPGTRALRYDPAAPSEVASHAD